MGLPPCFVPSLHWPLMHGFRFCWTLRKLILPLLPFPGVIKPSIASKIAFPLRDKETIVGILPGAESVSSNSILSLERTIQCFLGLIEAPVQ